MNLSQNSVGPRCQPVGRMLRCHCMTLTTTRRHPGQEFEEDFSVEVNDWSADYRVFRGIICQTSIQIMNSREGIALTHSGWQLDQTTDVYLGLYCRSH